MLQNGCCQDRNAVQATELITLNITCKLIGVYVETFYEFEALMQFWLWKEQNNKKHNTDDPKHFQPARGEQHLFGEGNKATQHGLSFQLKFGLHQKQEALELFS